MQLPSKEYCEKLKRKLGMSGDLQQDMDSGLKRLSSSQNSAAEPFWINACVSRLYFDFKFELPI